MVFKKGMVPWNTGLKHSGMSGKHHSEETKEKISIAHKGIPVPIERRVRISKTLTGYKDPPEVRLKKSLGHVGLPKPRGSGKKKGFPTSKETKKKISEANKGKVCSEETKKKLSLLFKGRNVSKETREKLRIARLGRRCPQKDTKIELILQNGLNQYEIKYKKHITVCGICQPDIVFPELKIAIFADGDYWHSKKIKKGKIWEKDRNQNRVLTENGWRVLRFWEYEIIKNPEICINKMIEVIRNGK